jgi:hypothetical protein
MPRGRGGARRGHEFYGNQYTKVAKYSRGKKRKSPTAKYERRRRIAIRGLKVAGGAIALAGAAVSARYGGHMVLRTARFIGPPAVKSAKWFNAGRGYRVGMTAARGAAAGYVGYAAASSFKTAGQYAKGGVRMLRGGSFNPVTQKRKRRKRRG